MDIDLARTFLEVAATGSFGAAAQRLHLTPTAISARIRMLEDQLGRPLFVRNKAGARLTRAGSRFTRYANTMVQLWERAQQQVALAPGREESVSVGGELSLWHPLMADWLIWMHRACPEIALRVEVESPARLLDGVQDGSLDLAVLYNPPQRPGLVCELLAEEKLVMVTSSPDGKLHAEQYIYVDWGPNFASNHEAAFHELGSPPVSISLGPLALTYLLTVGGTGYFRIGAAGPFLASGQLKLVEGAPHFSHSAFAVYAQQRENKTLERIRNGLRSIVLPGASPSLGNIIAPRTHSKGARKAQSSIKA